MIPVKYAAFLRGINVGGNSQVKMKDLKKVLEELGFGEVRTLLNSGNAIFEAPMASTKSLAEKIEEALENKFRRKIGVIVRTGNEIQSLIAKDPFKKIKITPDTKLYVTFYSDGEVYNALSKDQITTDLMKNLEKEYGKKNTTRNWNTLQRVGKNLN